MLPEDFDYYLILLAYRIGECLLHELNLLNIKHLNFLLNEFIYLEYDFYRIEKEYKKYCSESFFSDKNIILKAIDYYFYVCVIIFCNE
jgi:hypothetical protein